MVDFHTNQDMVDFHINHEMVDFHTIHEMVDLHTNHEIIMMCMVESKKLLHELTFRKHKNSNNVLVTQRHISVTPKHFTALR